MDQHHLHPTEPNGATPSKTNRTQWINTIQNQPNPMDQHHPKPTEPNGSTPSKTNRTQWINTIQNQPNPMDQHHPKPTEPNKPKPPKNRSCLHEPPRGMNPRRLWCQRLQRFPVRKPPRPRVRPFSMVVPGADLLPSFRGRPGWRGEASHSFKAWSVDGVVRPAPVHAHASACAEVARRVDNGPKRVLRCDYMLVAQPLARHRQTENLPNPKPHPLTPTAAPTIFSAERVAPGPGIRLKFALRRRAAARRAPPKPPTWE
ncbi:hypothetical protein APED_27660 [Acanthopleuribacter pedis]